MNNNRETCKMDCSSDIYATPNVSQLPPLKIYKINYSIIIITLLINGLIFQLSYLSCWTIFWVAIQTIKSLQLLI